MSLASRAGDLFYTFRFIKMLTTPFKDTDAFKLGIIDENGKRIKSKQVKTSEEKSAFTTFHRLVFNLKKLLEKLPGGKNTLSSYAAALFLLREKYDLSDDSIQKILDKMEVDTTNVVNEGWYQMNNNVLMPGVYKLKEDKLDIPQCNDIAFKGDTIRVKENCTPMGNIAGMNVYMVEHINTRQPIYVTLGDIYR